MADIIAEGNKYKRIIKIADMWLRSKLGASVKQVHYDMSNCGNPVFQELTRIVNEGGDLIDAEYQKRIVKNYGELFLWILYKDTAYRDVTIWMLNEILKNSDQLKHDLKPYLKDPKDMYVNSWVKSKEHSDEAKKANRISRSAKSLDEYIFTPSVQQKMLRKYK